MLPRDKVHPADLSRRSAMMAPATAYLEAYRPLMSKTRLDAAASVRELLESRDAGNIQTFRAIDRRLSTWIRDEYLLVGRLSIPIG